MSRGVTYKYLFPGKKPLQLWCVYVSIIFVLSVLLFPWSQVIKVTIDTCLAANQIRIDQVCLEHLGISSIHRMITFYLRSTYLLTFASDN